VIDQTSLILISCKYKPYVTVGTYGTVQTYDREDMNKYIDRIHLLNKKLSQLRSNYCI